MTTQYATASYQEIIDLQTQTDKVTVLGVHTPTSDAPYSFLQGFFDAFQKYHYDGCSMALVPAARLPADPSQVSYGAGSPPIDPRDLLNPILWHGAHGESLGSVLDQFYSGGGGTANVDRAFSDSVDLNEVSTSAVGNDIIWQSLYYRALTDNTWRKAHPQQGLRVKGLHPLVYSVATNNQYLSGPSGTLQPITALRTSDPVNPDDAGLSSVGTRGNLGPGSTNANLQVQATEGLETFFSSTGLTSIQGVRTGSSFFTDHLHGLGWLDTRSRTMGSNDNQSVQLTGTPADDRVLMQTLYENVQEVNKINYLPRLFMGVCLLPPAYKAEQYYRLVLNHKFSFKKFRGISMRGDKVGRFGPGAVPGYTNMLTESQSE